MVAFLQKLIGTNIPAPLNIIHGFFGALFFL